MLRTVEAVVDENGTVRLIVTSLGEETRESPLETAILSEPALSDWNRPEEDEAWASFPSEPMS
jgi:hypothetical protein